MLTFFNHFSCFMLYFFYIIYIFLKIWAPCLNAIFQLGSYKNALYNFIIICCDLHLIVLLIRPSVVFAFLIAILHCSENFMLLSIIIPTCKSLSLVDSLSTLPHKLYWCLRFYL